MQVESETFEIQVIKYLFASSIEEKTYKVV